MASDQDNDPLNFMRNMWGNMGFSLPGMVVPTFDLDGLDKQIKDMKAVEGWLRTNLSMLQMTIQSLEMQRTTVSTMSAMSQMASESAKAMAAEKPDEAGAETAAGTSAFSEAMMWPWQMMQQVQEHLQQQAATPDETAPPPKKPATRRRAGGKKVKGEG